MTKKEAITKISKLKQITYANSEPGEVVNAQKRIIEISKKHGLTESELEQGIRAEAFDDLMGELDRFVGHHRDKVPTPVFDVISKIKAETKEEDKAKALEKIVAGIRIASTFFGFNSTVSTIKSTVTSVLEKHAIKI